MTAAAAVAVAGVKHLPESAAARWPGETTYRPPGWQSELAPEKIGKRLIEVNKALEVDWESAALIAERDVLEAHLAILRQMWITRERVWRLAELLIGPPEVDPFWHPWSHVHRLWSGVRLLDGNEGRDGFDLSLWGRVTDPGSAVPFTLGGLSATRASSERGRTAYVNGPHGDTARYVETCTRAARAGHKVAAVVALDGNGWFAGNADNVPTDVLSCDLLCIPEGGRMSFEPPPGVKPSSPTKGYALAVWGASMDDVRRLPGAAGAPGGAVRVTINGYRWVILPGCGDASLWHDDLS